MPKRTKGMTAERHREVGAMLSLMNIMIGKLRVECSYSFGTSSKQMKWLDKLDQVLSEARSSLDGAMFNEHPELPDSATRVYYGMTEEKREMAMENMLLISSE